VASLHVFGEGPAFLQHHDIPAQGHHVASHPMSVVEHAVDESPRAGIQIHVLQDQAQLVGRVQHFGPRGRPQVHQAQEEVGSRGQRPDKGEGQEIEDAQRCGRPQRDRLRFLQGHGLGHQLAQHRVHKADEHEPHAQGQRLDGDSSPSAQGSDMGLDEAGQSRLAQPAQSQRRQGDAELIGRQERIQMARDP